MHLRQSFVPLIKEHLDDVLTAQEIASLLNSPVQIVEALQRRGKSALTTALEVLLWITSLWRNIHPLQAHADKLIALRDAAAVVPRQKHDFMSTILWSTQNSLLKGYAQTPYCELTQVYITKSAIQTVLAIFDEEHAKPKRRLLAPVVRISHCEMPDRFGVPVEAVQEWIRLGYLQSWSEKSGRGTNILCAETDLQHLIEDPPSITAHELGWLWGIVSKQAVSWAETGLLEDLKQAEGRFTYPGWDCQSRMVQLAKLQLPPPIHFSRMNNAVCMKEIGDWLTTQEVGQSLHVGASVVHQAQLANIITPIADCRLVSYFEQSAVQRLDQALEQGFTGTLRGKRLRSD